MGLTASSAGSRTYPFCPVAYRNSVPFHSVGVMSCSPDRTPFEARKASAVFFANRLSTFLAVAFGAIAVISTLKAIPTRNLVDVLPIFVHQGLLIVHSSRRFCG